MELCLYLSAWDLLSNQRQVVIGTMQCCPQTIVCGASQRSPATLAGPPDGILLAIKPYWVFLRGHETKRFPRCH